MRIGASRAYWEVDRDELEAVIYQHYGTPFSIEEEFACAYQDPHALVFAPAGWPLEPDARAGIDEWAKGRGGPQPPLKDILDHMALMNWIQRGDVLVRRV